MNSPFERPGIQDDAANATWDAAGAQPDTPNGDVGQEWVLREAYSERQSIIDFHRRLLELTPRVLVTRMIVAANLVVFVLMAVTAGGFFSPGGEVLKAWGANYGPATLDDQWWRVFTSMFVHVGVIHVAFNMWVLWDAGHLVERLVGNVGFLVLYVISGVCGSIASVFWNPHVNSAGASGAVFGVFGALMGFMLLRGDSIPKSILGRLRSSGLTFLAINLAIGFSIRWIDNAAHIGGLAAGFVCGVLMSHSLDRVTSRTRALRNVLVMVIAAIGFPVAACVAPEAPGDVVACLENFSATEKRALENFENARQRWERDEITDDEFTRIVETDVLRPWREARKKFDALKNVHPEQQKPVSMLRGYVKAREESWEALLAAVRERSEEKMKEYARKTVAADELLRELNSNQASFEK